MRSQLAPCGLPQGWRVAILGRTMLRAQIGKASNVNGVAAGILPDPPRHTIQRVPRHLRS